MTATITRKRLSASSVPATWIVMAFRRHMIFAFPRRKARSSNGRRASTRSMRTTGLACTITQPVPMGRLGRAGVSTPIPGQVGPVKAIPVPGDIDWWNTHANDIQVAPYAQATYHFTDKFDLTAGIRENYDWRQVIASYQPQYVNNGVPFQNQLAAMLAEGSGGNASSGLQSSTHSGVTAIINPKISVQQQCASLCVGWSRG